MTFSDIQARVADRLNLSSAAALTRIGQEINERYGEILSSVGLHVTIFAPTTANTTIGNRSLVFTAEKLFSVYDASVTPPRVLGEMTMGEMRARQIGTDPPRFYAIQLMGATTVTIYLDSVPGTIYTLTADAEIAAPALSGANVPAFSADFHDILVRGVMADELYKMEKYTLSTEQEKKFEKRLNELRYFIAKSAYKDTYQGKTAVGTPTYNLV